MKDSLSTVTLNAKKHPGLILFLLASFSSPGLVCAQVLLPATTSAAQGTCDPSKLGKVAIGPIAFGGEPGSGLGHVYISDTINFSDGPVETKPDGTPLPSTVINETLQIGFYEDWLSELAQEIENSVRSGIAQSCSDSLDQLSVTVSSYSPPTLDLYVKGTLRKCTSEDFPCGLPQVKCHGFPPQCSTKTPMCRTEQKVDIASVEAKVESQIALSYSGELPKQVVSAHQNIVRDDVKTSTGEIAKLLQDLGVGRLFGISEGTIQSRVSDAITANAREENSGAFAFLVPSPSFVYLPKTNSVSWVSPSPAPPGTKPIGIQLARTLKLPSILACGVVKCLSESQAAGKLLLDSCSVSDNQ